MKSIFTSLICMMAWSCVFSQSQTIFVETPGTLHSLLDSKELDASLPLSVSGSINGSDIKCLRELFGYVSVEDMDESKTASVTCLDLENARIVKGGEAYFFAPLSSLPKELASLYTEDDTIGSHMFSFCPFLESVILPKETKYIGSYAFVNMSGFKVLQSPMETPPACDETAFYNVGEKNLVVPNGSKDAYSEIPVWAQFGKILEKQEYELGIDEKLINSSSPIKNLIYDLQGRRLQAALAKGLYIRGGKKYLVR